MKGAQQNKTIWTIGHSTRTLDEFVELLLSFHIQCVADIRSYPGSRRYPHFNKEALEKFLPVYGIRYIHFRDLGGRRRTRPDSVNTGWRLDAFRGYADYMETGPFKKAITKLENVAAMEHTAFMCAERLWWRCHRSLVSDYLKLNGWSVLHIMNFGTMQEHPFTSPAEIVDGELRYAKKPAGKTNPI